MKRKKSSHGEARKESHDENGRFHRSSQTDNSGEAMKTCERIAEENGVSKATVLRASKYMKGVEIAESLIPGMREKILNKQVKVSKADMHRLARANYDARAQTLQEILHPELKVEPKPDADGIIREPERHLYCRFRKSNRFTTAMLTRKKCGMIMSHWNTLQHVSAQSLTIF